MASGSWTTYVRDSTHEYMQVSYSGTGSASSNATPLTVTIKFYAPYSISISSRTLTVAIDGTTHTLTTPSVKQGWTTLGTVTQTVNHSSNGSKSCSINVTYPLKATLGGTYYGNVTSNKTATLDNIPRKATINSAPNFTSNQNPTITFSNPGGFVINARMEFGGTNINRTSIANTGSYTFSLSTAERNLLFSKCTTSNTLTVRFVIATKINSTSETDWSWFDRTMTVQSGNPTFTSITSERIDGVVPSSWGIYVKGKSKCKLTINGASGIYGSSISGYSISGGGYSGSTSPYTTGYLNTSGTVTFSGKVIDSRPNRESSTKTTSIYVYDYATPYISSITSVRCNSSGSPLDDGTYLKVKCDFTYYSCNSNNTVTATVRYRRSGTDTSGNPYSWSSAYSISDNTELVIGSGYINIDYAYDIEYKVVDYFGDAAYRYDMVMSSFSIMDFKPGGAGVAGVAIGKSATESNLFDIGMPTRIQDLNGIVKATGGTLGTATSGTDYISPDDESIILTGNYISSRGSDVPFRHTHPTSGKEVKFGVGSGGTNRGIYDSSLNKWIIYTNGTNTYIGNSSGSYAIGVNNVLWSGGLYMNQNQTITLSQAVSAQQTGIVLVFSEYNTSTQTPGNSMICSHFVSKHTVSVMGGCGHYFNQFSNWAGAMCKYLYISNTTIRGHSVNDDTGAYAGITYDNTIYVLRYVIGV